MVIIDTILIFVYGTLMSGQRASGYLDGCALLGRYCLRDYAMYNLGAYPGIVPQEGETVVGEVYCVPADRLPELDAYEGEGSLYHRRAVTVEREGSRVPAGRMPVRAPQGGSMPVSSRAAWKKASFTSFCVSRL